MILGVDISFVAIFSVISRVNDDYKVEQVQGVGSCTHCIVTVPQGPSLHILLFRTPSDSSAADGTRRTLFLYRLSVG